MAPDWSCCPSFRAAESGPAHSSASASQSSEDRREFGAQRHPCRARVHRYREELGNRGEPLRELRAALAAHRVRTPTSRHISYAMIESAYGQCALCESSEAGARIRPPALPAAHPASAVSRRTVSGSPPASAIGADVELQSGSRVSISFSPGTSKRASLALPWRDVCARMLTRSKDEVSGQNSLGRKLVLVGWLESDEAAKTSAGRGTEPRVCVLSGRRVAAWGRDRRAAAS